MTEPTDAKRHGYWSDVEADAATVVHHIKDAADEWDVLGVDLASDAEEGDVLFLLVIRRRVNDDGHLILSERYFRYSVLDREGSWLSNGIERRVRGSLASALKVMYAAASNGDLDPESPMLIDSRSGDGLDHNPDALEASVRDLRRDDSDADAEADLEQDPQLKESAEGRTTKTVECEECGGQVAREDAVNLGGEFGVDVWSCEEEHVADPFGGDDDE